MVRRSSNLSPVFLVSLCIIVAAFNVEARYSSMSGGNCETLPSTVHITKEEYSSGGILTRACEGDVGVAKCEGSCPSQVQPSVVYPSGFLKECMCCRESFLRERVVSLTHCYDSNGSRLDGEKGTMEVKLREPADCKCFRCGESFD